MENKRLHIEATEESHYRILGKNGRRTGTAVSDLSEWNTGGRNRENTWNIRGIKRTEKNGEPKEELIWESSCMVRTPKRKRRIDITQAPYLAKGDGKALNTAAIQQAIEDCKEDEMVYVPAGTF